MIRAVALAAGAALAALSCACGMAQDPGTGTAVIASSPTGAASASASPTSSPSGDQTGQAPFVMPNLVGWVLQDAQDEIQRITGNPLFITTSTDATGQRRAQVLDRNWKVCSQSVPAGAPFTEQTPINFGVVRLEETCP